MIFLMQARKHIMIQGYNFARVFQRKTISLYTKIPSLQVILNGFLPITASIVNGYKTL